MNEDENGTLGCFGGAIVVGLSLVVTYWLSTLVSGWCGIPLWVAFIIVILLVK